MDMFTIFNCNTAHSHCSNHCLCVLFVVYYTVTPAAITPPTLHLVTLLVGDDIPRFTTFLTFPSHPNVDC